MRRERFLAMAPCMVALGEGSGEGLNEAENRKWRWRWAMMPSEGCLRSEKEEENGNEGKMHGDTWSAFDCSFPCPGSRRVSVDSLVAYYLGSCHLAP